MNLILRGRVWKFGDNISGDDGIINMEVVRTQNYNPDELRKICMWRYVPDFYKKTQKGDIIIAGEAFAHPPHPPVVIALKSCGISAVIAKSFGHGFIRKSLNMGLAAIVSPNALEIGEQGDIVEVDPLEGEVRNITKGTSYKINPLPEFMVEMLEADGLVPYLKREFASQASAGSK